MVKRMNQLDQENNDLKKKLDDQKEELDSEVNTLKKKLNEKEEQVDFFKNMLEKLKDKIECPVCLGIPRGRPVPVCPNGHVVCTECKRDTCPTCRIAMGTNTSLLAGTVLENIEHNCKFGDCNENFSLEDLKKHEAVCLHRTVNCPSTKCAMKTSLTKLLVDHLRNSKECCGGGHHLALENWNRMNFVDDTGDVFQRNEGYWPMHVYFNPDGEILAVFPIKSERQFYFMVVMFASETQCSKYKFEMIVHETESEALGLDSVMAAKFCGNPLSIDLMKEELKLYNTGEKLMAKIVKKSIDGKTFSLSFKISKKDEK